MSTIDRILHQLHKQDKKQKDLTDYLGITKNSITDWKSGRIKSYNKYLPQIAEFLNVSVDYLLSKDIQEEITSNSSGFTEHETELVYAYRNHPNIQPVIDKLLDIE